mgnify:CR=1 FL=1
MPKFRNIVFYIIFVSFAFAQQTKWESGVFTTFPSLMYINHIYADTWQSYIALNDRVMILDTEFINQESIYAVPKNRSLSDGPILMVWGSDINKILWMVTPQMIHLLHYDIDAITSEYLSEPIERDKLSLALRQSSITILQGEEELQSFDLLTGGIIQKDESEILEYVVQKDPRLKSQNLAMEVTGDIDYPNWIENNQYNYSDLFPISSGWMGPNGNVILGTFGGGLYINSSPNERLHSLSMGPLDPYTLCLYQDNNKLLIGSSLGLTSYEGSEYKYRFSSSFISDNLNRVSAITSNDKYTWVAAKGGVFRLDKSSNSYKKAVDSQLMESDRIYALDIQEHRLAIAGAKNAFVKVGNTPLQKLFKENTSRAIFEIRFYNDFIITVGEYGLNLFDAYTYQPLSTASLFESFPEKDELSQPIYNIEIKDDWIWMTSNKGIMGYNLVDKVWKIFETNSQELKPTGLSVSNNIIWIGTPLGLASFNYETIVWETYTLNDGLISNFITDVLVDENYVWVATDRGLTRVNWRKL